MKKFERIMLIIGVIVLLGKAILPQMGELALWDVLMTSMLMLCAVVYLVVYIIYGKKELKKKALICAIILIVLCGGATIVNTKNVVCDLIAGPERVTLQNCQVVRQTGLKGIANLHYYLYGVDENGKNCRFEISADAYEKLEGRNSVTMSCYWNVKRIVSY